MISINMKSKVAPAPEHCATGACKWHESEASRTRHETEANGWLASRFGCKARSALLVLPTRTSLTSSVIVSRSSNPQLATLLTELSRLTKINVIE
jgi:hypothetical protein